MRDLILIIGIPFLIALTLKIIYLLTVKKEVRQESINLMSEIANYDTYIQINDNIVNGEV